MLATKTHGSQVTHCMLTFTLENLHMTLVARDPVPSQTFSKADTCALQKKKKKMKSTVCWPICYTNTHEQFTESTTLLKDAVCEELHFSTCFYCVDVQVRALLYRDTSRRLHQWKASLVNVCNDFVFYINSIECQDFKSLSSCWFYSHCMFMFSSVWSRL